MQKRSKENSNFVHRSMAPNNKSKAQEGRIEIRRADSETVSEHEPEEDLEKLEFDVKQMAGKILEYRATLPDQVRATLASMLSAQRPISAGIESVSDPEPSAERNPDPGHAECCNKASVVSEEQETEKKILLLKEKRLKNISAMPLVLKRLKECISRIDKLDTFNASIDPVFKKRKTS